MVSIFQRQTKGGGLYSEAMLESGSMAVSVLSLGAATRSIRFGGTEALLSHPDADSYRNNRFYLGAIAGRVANRISNAAFMLNGRTHTLSRNWRSHHLHGGAEGFSQRNWTLERDSAANAVRLRLRSEDGDQGYPGAVDVAVTITLADDVLTYDMSAVPDAPTPLNLAQHNYYLSDAPGTSLQVNASRYCPTDDDLIPTGDILPVAGKYDLTQFRDLTDMARKGDALDTNFVVDGGGMRQAAVLRVPGRFEMTLETDQPGVQVYTGGGLSDPFEPFQGLCLEPQYFPNAINTPGFGDTVHTPDRPYRQTTRLRWRKL